LGIKIWTAQAKTAQRVGEGLVNNSRPYNSDRQAQDIDYFGLAIISSTL
jgi:hypothetical protein